MGTTFIEETEDCAAVCTEFAQSKARNPDRRVKFPVTVEYYDQRAKIYTPAKGFPFYRVAFRVAGKRRMLTFATYGEAKKAAEEGYARMQEIAKATEDIASQADEMQNK